MELNSQIIGFFSESIFNNRPVMIFIRNNKKLLGYIRAYDRHMNLVLENVKEIRTIRNAKGKLEFHEKYFSKLILRGDSIVLSLRI